MRRSAIFSLCALGLLAGCVRQAPAPQAVQPDDEPAPKPVVHKPGPAPDERKPLDALLAGVTEPTAQDRYDASLLEALNLLAEKKEAEALSALETAKKAQDTDQVQQEIERLRAVIARRDAAAATVQNIRAVLDDGRFEEASKLASDALAEYGGSDQADELLKLKRQADALLGAKSDAGDRRKRFRAEADAALDAKNLRGAAAALEQALQDGDDADLRKQLDDVRDRLKRYDDNRRRAEELRRDPTTLDDAVAALQDAQKAWDTIEVRRQIDDYTLAQQKRRDRIAVADFEVRGDVGLADAGRTLAEELLPAFKVRYDLVEREQVAKVVEELKLEAGDLGGDARGRAEVGRLAKVRYLVVGSVSRMGGVTVNARLVDVQSGLVVQTARVTAATADDLVPLLPQLATVLMMTDEQRMAYEEELARQAATVAKVTDAPPPPPPEAGGPPPPPLVTTTPGPLPLGKVDPDNFDKLPPPPPVETGDDPVKLRLRQVLVEVGDNLFRRGLYAQAEAQYEAALGLGGDPTEVQTRIDRCQALLAPPPPVVVFVPPPPPRPRIAVLDFVVVGDPRVVPPVLGPWTADALAPYFSPPYEVVDRDEVCWYMNRMGLTLGDVLNDPGARRWLARALHVRYFVFGVIRQTHSFTVTTHLVDAEFGFEVGTGRVHVHNPFELKCRLGELARQTLLDPAERRRRQKEAEEAERVAEQWRDLEDAERLRRLRECDDPNVILIEIQRRGDTIDIDVVVEILGRCRERRPDNIEINVLFERFGERARRKRMEEARRREFEKQQALAAEMQRRQLELARAAEEARIRAAQEAARREADQRRALEQQRRQGFDDLRVRAKLAFQQKNFEVSIQLYQSALGLGQSDDAYRELALARAAAEEAARARAAQDAAAREAALLKQREEELAKMRLALGEERRRREAEEKAREDQDLAVYTRLLDDAQKFEAKGQYDAAVTALQNARQLRNTDEVQRLLTQAVAEQARAEAEKKGARERDELERRLADEKARREKAEAEAEQNRKLYQAALELAQKAMSDKRYDVAVAKYEEAGKLYNSDVVLTGVRQAKALQVQEQESADAEKKKQEAEAKKADDLKRWKDAGKAALDAKQYDRAVDLLTKAKNAAPTDVDVLTALAKAEQAKADADAKAKSDAEIVRRDAAFRQYLDGGKANLAAKQYESAVVALREAVKLKPGDKDAADALQQAEKGLADAKLDAEQTRKKQESYQKLMGDGRTALAARQYDAAIQAFTEAGALLPGDKSAAGFLADARKAKGDADAVRDAEAKKREQEQQRAAAVQKALTQFRAALAVKDLDAARKALDEAVKNDKDSAEVKTALNDLEKAVNAVKADAEAKKKRADDFQTLLKKGKLALDEKRFDEAVQEFSQASQLIPDDADAKALLAKAVKARADALSAADQDAARKAAADRADKVKKAVADARAAVAAKDFDKASKLLAEAHQLAPDDPDVAKVQKELADANKAAADKLEEQKKRQAAYAQAMDAGRAALRKSNFEGAINSFNEALKQLPDDKDAAAALKDAQTAKANADADAKRKADEAKKREDYNALMAKGQKAMGDKQYGDAAKAFTDALALLPNDPAAAKALKDAQQAAADAAKADADKKKREADYADAMKAGKAAMSLKKYDDAVKAFTEAGRLTPGDKDAAAALKDAKDAAAAEADKVKRQADYADAMKAGRAAMTAKKYADAVKAFTEAGKILPGDKDAAAALKDAQNAAADADKKKQEEAKRQEDFNKLMAQGQAAVTAKRFDDAAKLFADALKLEPDDPGAAKALKDAQNAAADVAKAEADKKKREADYNAAMQAGRDALKAKKYADAIKSFTDAGKIIPGDKAAADALKDAQNAADAEKKKMQEEAKRLEDLNRLKTQAQAALAAKRYDEAARDFSEALKLDPNDAAAAKGLKDAQQAAADAAKAEADKKKREADYAAAMQAGRDAVKAKRFDDAVKDFTDAGKLLPGDKAAADALKDAQGAAADEAKRKADEAKKQEDYNKQMQQGNTALTGKKYDDAVKAFTAALQVQPGDAKGTTGLQNAQFGQHMAAGAALQAAKKYADAVKEYQAALAIFPDDAGAKAALKRAQDNKP
jgi:tetratricopeptide (TPR) repeat protein